MVADVYSHIIDDDRCLNAQRMEEAFYSGQKKRETGAAAPVNAGVWDGKMADGSAESHAASETDVAMLMRLLQKPEMAQLLKTLAKNL